MSNEIFDYNECFKKLFNLLSQIIQKLDNLHSTIVPKKNLEFVNFCEKLRTKKIPDQIEDISNYIFQKLNILEQFIINISKKKEINNEIYRTNIFAQNKYENSPRGQRTVIFERKNNNENLYQKLDNKTIIFPNQIKYETEIKKNHNNLTDFNAEFKNKNLNQIKINMPYSCRPRLETNYPDISFEKNEK